MMGERRWRGSARCSRRWAKLPRAIPIDERLGGARSNQRSSPTLGFIETTHLPRALSVLEGAASSHTGVVVPLLAVLRADPADIALLVIQRTVARGTEQVWRVSERCRRFETAMRSCQNRFPVPVRTNWHACGLRLVSPGGRCGC